MRLVPIVFSLSVLFALPAFCADRFPASGGDITITPITHASVQLEHGGMVIQVDPWSSGDYSHARSADLILITGAENDHLDPDAIRKIRKPDTAIVIPAAAKDKVPDGIVIENNQVKNVAGIRVEAVASYDLIPGTPFHPKGRGNGYVITLGDKRIYFSGVTECVAEVQALRNIDVAFVVMNSPNGRMTPAAAAACVATFKPKVVYPYHYRAGNVAEFKAALDGMPVDVRLGDWYPVAVK
jgi:L-ascorbate metabolism protein UlaG (beta-lactamase superfamily)